MIELRFDGEERSLQAKDRLTVLVFGSSWCQPCAQLKKQLQEVERARTNVIGAYVDVSTAPRAAETYGVKALPTIIFLRGGSVVCFHSGMLTRNALLELIDEH